MNPRFADEVPDPFQTAPSAKPLEVDADDPEARYEELLSKLRREHGKIKYWETEFGLVVAGKPKNAAREYQALVNFLQEDEVDKAVALENFARKCVLYPDIETTKRIFRDLPAFALSVAAAGQKLCGAGLKAMGKD